MNTRSLPFRQRADYCGERPEPLAFTFTELLVVLGVLGLLAALALPALAGTRFRSQQTVCLNNLSRIGQAFAQWGSEHGDRSPYTTPWWEGGLVYPTQPPRRVPPPGALPPLWYLLGLQDNAWFHYWWMSNELTTPKVLACPSDSERRAASDFSSTNANGFLTHTNRNISVTYGLSHSGGEDGRLILAGERRLQFDSASGGGGCSYGLRFNAVVPYPYPASYGWVGGIHPRSGGLLFTDGSAEQTDNAGLREAVNRFEAGDTLGGFGNSYPHFIMPH